MPYLNVTEVESALSVASSAPFDGFTERFALPNLTWEGRQCHAIKIANGSNAGRPGLYFLGGIHAREWGSSDILINFVEQLEQAYHGGTALAFGTRTFTAAEIQSIVEALDVIIFPQANPDGRNFSMTTHAMWRKNRRTAAPNSTTCPGVDLNRNYDFLWDFPTYFDPAAGIVDSTDPCDAPNPDNGTYHGASAFSEPETQNSKWIFDTYPNVGFFVDVHSFSEDILYTWGDDENQTSDPSLNFMNPAYNGARGIEGDAYGEYIPSDDLATAIDLANAMHDGIAAFRGKDYTVESAYKLYPTAGTGHDYAYSRHFVDPGKKNVIAYTLEWGLEFQPLYSEMQNIIQEITSGLLEFCLRVRNRMRHVAFVVERSTLGQDEVDARRAGGSAVVPDVFRVVVDGFTAAELGVSGPGSLLSVSSPIGGLSFTCRGNTSETGDYGPEVQRFTFDFDADFGPTDAAFGFSADTEFFTVDVTVGGLPASAELELIKQPDPFIMHGDPTWLSVDLRVFTVRAGETMFGRMMGSSGVAAPGFIQDVIADLNAGDGTAGGESFSGLSTGEAAASLFVEPTDGSGTAVFNFALAKVHYIGLIGAVDVRVFFRLFQAQSMATVFDFPPGGRYRRAASNPDGQPIPLAGIHGGEYATFPCFAEARVDSTTVAMDQQTDPRNVQTFTAGVGGVEVDRFYGCWLDFNQPFKPDGVTPNNVLPATVPGSPVDGPFTDPAHPPLSLQQAILRFPHQCLVAEIAFDPVAIPVGKDPGNWDKLAQRNLAWSDLGSAEALCNFEITPTRSPLPVGAPPDELMIDWRRTPDDGCAEVYLPALEVDEVLALADGMYATHDLSRVDAHTVRCTTRGITYIPIPPGGSVDHTGLLSVDLPDPLRRGERFDVIVRQVTNASGKRRQPPPPPPPGPGIDAAGVAVALGTSAIASRAEIHWRRVLGAFQLSIPVKDKAILLEPEERLLSVMRWIGQAIPAQSRWYLVFRRYLERLGGRVSSFGGDPAQIEPSPTGQAKPRPHKPPSHPTYELTGKIAGLNYDHFGDFEGFILETDHQQHHHFHSREPEIAELAQRAWRERLRLTVYTDPHHPNHPVTITIHPPPTAFTG
jgi:murein tripeptide amidase MpaA